jgi:hypothetical protein
MRLQSSLSAWLNRKPQRQALIEQCDARILYSADLNPGLWATDSAAPLRHCASRDGPAGAADDSALADSVKRKAPGVPPAPPPRRKA